MRAKLILKEYLKSRGFKAKWLAERIGTSPSQLSKWMNNRTLPEATWLLLMARELGCRVEDICVLDDSN